MFHIRRIPACTSSTISSRRVFVGGSYILESYRDIHSSCPGGVCDFPKRHLQNPNQGEHCRSEDVTDDSRPPTDVIGDAEKRSFGRFTLLDRHSPFLVISSVLLLGILLPRTDKTMVSFPSSPGIQFRPG